STDSRRMMLGRPIGTTDIVLFLLLACAAKIGLMLGIEGAFNIQDHFTVKNFPQSFYEKQWWQYLLPHADIYGTWTATSVVAAALLQQHIPPAIVLVTSHCVLIITGFFVTLSITRSMVFAATAAILFVTVPFNFHVHSSQGTTAHAMLLSYFLITVHSIYLLMHRQSVVRWAYLAVSAFLFILGYETWLDTVIVLLVLTPAIIFVLRKNGQENLVKRFTVLPLSAVGVTIVYVFIKVVFGFGSGAGSETELLLFYPSILAMIDDFMVKMVSFSFTAVSLVLPGFLTGSLSLPTHGADWIIGQQNGYHGQMQFLTYMNHVFLWRIHAGVSFVVLLGLGAWALRRLSQGKRDWQSWMILICVAMLLFGAATHNMVKYRPMHSMPYLGYQVWVNVLGAIGLMGLAIDALVKWVEPRRQWLTLFFCWSGLVFTGFSVRSKLTVEAATMTMGNYPSLF
ncbi:MAG: hypothetical protein AAGF58_08055, partial [Pseudomonadota bacterium]